MSDYQLSELQKKKILHVFNTFYDTNHDGVIEWKDFELAIQKIRGLHSWATDGEKHRQAKSTLSLIWEGLKKYADENRDDKITQEEWLKMWTECVRAAENGKDLPDWQHKYMCFMFDVNDTSGDDLIDKSEYTTVYTSYGISKTDCEEAFDKFSENGKVKIDRHRYADLWREYFLSNKIESKGNYIFGLVSF